MDRDRGAPPPETQLRPAGVVAGAGLRRRPRDRRALRSRAVRRAARQLRAHRSRRRTADLRARSPGRRPLPAGARRSSPTIAACARRSSGAKPSCAGMARCTTRIAPQPSSSSASRRRSTTFRRFERWRKETEGAAAAAALAGSRPTCARRAAASPMSGSFRTRCRLTGMRSPIEYRLAPGEPDDGATIEVPLAMLGGLDAGRLAWGVPGQRAELVEALIRGLPKALRRPLVPAPATAAAVLAEADTTMPMWAELARLLSRRAGQPIAERELAAVSLPDHLRFHFRVIGEDGRVLAQGRDLASLRASLRGEGEEALRRSTRDFAQSGLRDWDHRPARGLDVDRPWRRAHGRLSGAHRRRRDGGPRGVRRCGGSATPAPRRRAPPAGARARRSAQARAQGPRARPRTGPAAAAARAAGGPGRRHLRSRRGPRLPAGRPGPAAQPRGVRAGARPRPRRGVRSRHRDRRQGAVGAAGGTRDRDCAQGPAARPRTGGGRGLPGASSRVSPVPDSSRTRRTNGSTSCRACCAGLKARVLRLREGRNLAAQRELVAWRERVAKLADPALAGEMQWLLAEYCVSLFAQPLGTRVPVSAKRLAQRLAGTDRAGSLS